MRSTTIVIRASTAAAAERLALGVVDRSRRECFHATAEELYEAHDTPARVATTVVDVGRQLHADDTPARVATTAEIRAARRALECTAEARAAGVGPDPFEEPL